VAGGDRLRVLAWSALLLAPAFLLTGGPRPAAAPPVPDGLGLAGTLALVPALALCGLLPGWWLARGLGIEEPFARTGWAVLLSALLSVLLGLGALALDLPLFAVLPALWPLALAPWAARLASRSRGAVRAAGADHPPGAERGAAAWSALAVAAWVLVVVLTYAANPELRYRVDGWFHGAVTGRLLAGGVPPEDPYFAGQPLGYPWAWHVLLAVTMQAGSRLGVTAFDAMAGWSALAALSVGALLAALARAWARAGGLGPAARDRAGAFAVAAAVIGTNPLGAWFALGRGFLGADAGPAAWTRAFAHGAGDVLWSLTWHYPHVSLASFVDKFLTPTAFSLGEAALLAAAAVLVAPRTAAGGVPALVPSFLAAALAWLVHGAAGSGLVLVAVASMLVLARGGGPGRGRGRALLAAVAGAGLLAAPYLAMTRGGGGGGLRFAVQADVAWAIAAVGVVVVVLALSERARLGRPADGRHAWFAGGFTLLAAALVLSLVQRNETKLVNLGLLALAVPAGVAWARLPRPAALVLLAALVPTHALAVAGFAFDRGQETPGRRVPAADLRSAYAWIGEHTGPRDLFLEGQGRELRDPDRDLVVHGPRSLVWGGLGYAANWGYDAADLARRERAARELAGDSLSAASAADLARRAARVDGRIYAVRRGTGVAGPAALPGGGAVWTRVFANGALALDRLDPVGGTRP
jgi:hypothetical protein